jgi:type II secretory pathway pseudopilin PulG
MTRRLVARGSASSRRRGLTIIELIVAVAVCALLGAVFLAAHEPQRRLASLHESFNNLREMGAAYASYAHENQDRISTFTWAGGVVNPSTFPDLSLPWSNDVQASAAQLADIARRRGPEWARNFPPLLTFIPQFRYHHMPLLDFLGLEGPWWAGVSPEDNVRVRWLRDPEAFLAGQAPPQPSGVGGNGYGRWLFSSSYVLTYAAFSPDSGQTSVQPGGQYPLTVTPATAVGVYGRRVQAEVRSPAQKILLFDEAQRHFGERVALFGYAEARIPVLAFDGATSVRVSRDNDRGWNPGLPGSPSPVTVTYSPEAWQPQRIDGQSTINPGMQWTRDGLRGRDFDR